MIYPDYFQFPLLALIHHQDLSRLLPISTPRSYTSSGFIQITSNFHSSLLYIIRIYPDYFQFPLLALIHHRDLSRLLPISTPRSYTSSGFIQITSNFHSSLLYIIGIYPDYFQFPLFALVYHRDLSRLLPISSLRSCLSSGFIQITSNFLSSLLSII